MSWQEELRNGIRTAEQLAPILGWSPEETARRAEIIERFPMLITPYYLSLVDPSDPNDPIGRMCVPTLDEFDPGGSFDTSGEASNTKLEGLQHKYAQTVLLRGVNDSGEVLGQLLSRLTRVGIAPYYVFQCRPVTGVKERFQVPIREGIRIVNAAKARQNGFGKSIRYAMSHPRGKIEIIRELPSGETVFKFHQSKDDSDNARIFTLPLSPADTWLDEDLRGI